VVTGIRAGAADADKIVQTGSLQWGPVVVTGIRRSEPEAGEPGAAASMGSGRGDRNQPAPVPPLAAPE